MGISSSANIIRTRITEAPAGTVFTAVDFSDVTQNSRVGVILSRLEEDGTIRRIMRGIYDKPIYNDFIKEYLAPSPSLVAEAIARSFGWTIVPCGDTAVYDKLGIMHDFNGNIVVFYGSPNSSMNGYRVSGQ